jgi:hypothetical protein
MPSVRVCPQVPIFTAHPTLSTDNATLQAIAGYHNAAVGRGKIPGQWMGDGVPEFDQGMISTGMQPDTRDTATSITSQAPTN